MTKKRRKGLDGWDSEEIQNEGFMGWLDNNKYGVLYSILVIFLILVLLALASLRSVVKVAEAEGEIIEIKEGMFRILVTDVVFLNEGQVKNPVEITSGICFNQLLMDKCNVGSKVRLTKYRSLFAEWWTQDSIIASYNQTFR